MSLDLKQAARFITTCMLVTVFSMPTNLVAQTHVVSPAELQKEVRSASETRERNLEEVRQFLSSEKAQTAIKSAHMDPTQVTSAVSSLSDAELAQMAARAHKAQADFAAGSLSNRDLLLIILGVAALVLLIVIFR